jgi:DNA replication protein DnaC
MLHLPPLSKHIRVLTQEESARLDAKYPSTLPKSLRDCVTCRGKKQFKWWTDYGISEEIGTYECPCSEQFVLYKYLLNSGLGLELQRYAVGDLKGVPIGAFDAAMDYVDESDYYVGQGYNFIFRGDRGTGKTLLATLTLKQLLDKGIDGYFTTFNDMLDNFTAGWNNDETRVWFEARAKNAPLLVVDDIGKEYEGRVGISKVMIDNIFRSRVNDALPTIITTNLTAEQMGLRYSAALETIASKSRTFEFNGTTWRNSAQEIEQLRKELDNKLTRPVLIK